LQGQQKGLDKGLEKEVDYEVTRDEQGGLQGSKKALTDKAKMT